MKKIIVLAGGADQVSLIKNLRIYFGQIEIILIDRAPHTLASIHADKHLIISTVDKEAVLDIAKQEKVDMIITACGDQPLLTMAYVSEKLKLPCYLTYEQAIKLTNKLYMKEEMLKYNISTSKYQIINELTNIRPDLTFPLVVKAVDNNGSKGIIKVMSENAIKEALSESLSYSRSKTVLIEEFIDGDEYSIEAFIEDGIAKIVVITKLLKIKQNEDRFTILRCTYPCNLSENVLVKIEQIITEIAIAFKISTAPFMIQLIVDKSDNVSVVEFSARTGGGSKHELVQKATGINIFENLLDLTIGKRPQINVVSSNKHISLNYVYTKPGYYSGVFNFDFLKHQGIIEEYFLYKLPGDEIKRSAISSDRPAGFMVIADSEEESFDKIRQIEKSVKVLDINNNDIMIHGLYEKSR